jgi:tetratricopeptide (TPR) repeat protein
MKNLLLSLLFFAIHIIVFGQNDSALKRLEAKLEQETNAAAKIEILVEMVGKSEVSILNNEVSPYLLRAILVAEESRDRTLMVKVRRYVASFFLGDGQFAERTAKARTYAEEAYKICKTEKVDIGEKMAINTLMARVERYSGNAAKGLTYNQEAISLANESGDDSLRVISQVACGNTELFLDENIKAFKNYLAAQAIAEKTKGSYKSTLLATVYGCFVKFYSNMEDFEKAIDYQYKVLEIIKAKQKAPLESFQTKAELARLYSNAKKYDNAKSIYVQLEKLADSLKDKNYIISARIGLLNVLIDGPDKKEALTYLRKNPEIFELFEKQGIVYLIDAGMGQFFHELKMYDSASFYYKKAMPSVDSRGSMFTRIDAHTGFGKHLYAIGSYNAAKNELQTALALCDTIKNLSKKLGILEKLDSCYQKLGDFKNAYATASLYKKTKKEFDEKSKAKDLLALEIDGENKRKEAQELLEKEETNKRHNWQYMGIIMAILGLFTLLAAFGVFKVSLKWIRALGFISFILLFEFIILIADTWIHHATHGEPWKVLGIKVILIALLLPLHHFLEHKVIQYITRHRSDGKNTDELLAMKKTKAVHFSSKKNGI